MNDGADVRIAGVKVGSVENMRIDPKSFLADVTLTVRDDIHLPKDTAAEITSESLLGGKYLNLSPGGDSADIPAGGTHHRHPVLGFSRATTGQIHFQRRQSGG